MHDSDLQERIDRNQEPPIHGEAFHASRDPARQTRLLELISLGIANKSRFANGKSVAQLSVALPC